MVPYSEHNKYEVKLVKNEPHNEFVLNVETAFGDLGLNDRRIFCCYFIHKAPPEPNCVGAPSSRPRGQAAEDAKAIISLALMNDEKLRHQTLV